MNFWLGLVELLVFIMGFESGLGFEKVFDLEWEGWEWVKEGV